MDTKPMTCMHCGVKKAWPDGFYSMTYAECWKCVFERHVRDHHPPTRKQKREMKRKIKRKVAAEMQRELEEMRTSKYAGKETNEDSSS